MRTLSLEDAVWEISQATAAPGSPFFFMVGAGISAPEIPLAEAIADDCKSRAEGVRQFADIPVDPLERYSYWFERAFPQPRQRQQYLAKILGDVKISQANLRLAHLLSAGVLGHLVITLNFDEGVERALALFDVPFLVCDHPSTVERIEVDRDTTQIVHVHGTFWFYDCCNLRGEIADRAAPESQGMQSLLDRVLSTRSPLVFGYSGWESDVVMTSLRRRLAGRLPYILYWFSYDGNISELPDWLTTHQDVVFVVPAVPDPSSEESVDASVLDAATCFEALIHKFDLEPPAAVANPIGALLDRLKRQVPSLGVDAGYEDLYQLGGVIADLESVVVDQARESDLERIRDAYRKSEYREVLELSERIPVSVDSKTEAQIATMIASSLVRSKESILDLVERFESSLERVRSAARVTRAVRTQLGTALNEYGRELGSARRFEEALRILDESIALEWGDSGARERQRVRANSLKVTALLSLNRLEEAVDIARWICAATADDPAMEADNIVGRLNLGTALVRQGNADEGLAHYQAVESSMEARRGQAAYWKYLNRYLEAAVAAQNQEAIDHVLATVAEVVREFPDEEQARLLAVRSEGILDRPLEYVD